MYSNLDDLFYRLSKSKFRSSFHLNSKMKEYAKTKGLDEIERHAYEIINKRLKPSLIPNDGRQTPMKQTHPVFISQHATATCCRKCLNKWHNINKNNTLSEEQIDYIVKVIMKWIKSEL